MFAGTADFATTTEAMNIANLTATNAILVNSSGEMNLGSVTVAERLDANIADIARNHRRRYRPVDGACLGRYQHRAHRARQQPPD